MQAVAMKYGFGDRAKSGVDVLWAMGMFKLVYFKCRPACIVNAAQQAMWPTSNLNSVPRSASKVHQSAGQRTNNLHDDTLLTLHVLGESVRNLTGCMPVLCRGVIKATFIISGLMVFAVAAATIAMKTGFADRMKERLQQPQYQSVGDSTRPVNGLQLSSGFR